MKLKTRPVAGIVCVMALGATLAACSSGSSSSSGSSPVASASGTSALTTVSVGNFPNSALTLPFAIAQDQGYFRDAGLNVQAVSAASGPVLASELIGGSTQMFAAGSCPNGENSTGQQITTTGASGDIRGWPA